MRSLRCPAIAAVAVAAVATPQAAVKHLISKLTHIHSSNASVMKSKKLLLIGLLIAGLAASGIAAYQQCTGSVGTECCFPGCCADGQTTDCCKAEN